MNIFDAIKLDAWEDTHGISSLQGTVCPRCQHLHEPDRSKMCGRQTCEKCHVPFDWSVYATAAGQAWVTHSVEPAATQQPLNGQGGK